jgi:D-alanyl-D-alanine carboxypeptidase
VRSVYRYRVPLRLLVTAAVAAGVLVPAAAAQSDPSAQRDKVRSQAAQVALDVNTLKAQDSQIQAALAKINANVAAQQAKLTSAKTAQATADRKLADAKAAVARTQARYDRLNDATDALVVESFMTPAGDDALEVLKQGSLEDSAIKSTLEEIQTESDQQLLDQLSRTKAALAEDRSVKADSAKAAAQKRTSASKALADVKAAQSQQQAFANEVEKRLDAKLSEAAALSQTDAALSRQITAQQDALAASLANVTPAATSSGSSSISAPPGGLATVACPTGGSITVAGQIAANVRALLAAAASAGVIMCGGGYRDPAAQIALRKAHCGTTNYDIYDKPASQCSPPTARPGTSMHEQGLAIDFTINGSTIGSHSDPAWQWLNAHAGSYGFRNLASEPWHWSTNGN